MSFNYKDLNTSETKSAKEPQISFSKGAAGVLPLWSSHLWSTFLLPAPRPPHVPALFPARAGILWTTPGTTWRQHLETSDSRLLFLSFPWALIYVVKWLILASWPWLGSLVFGRNREGEYWNGKGISGRGAQRLYGFCLEVLRAVFEVLIYFRI